MTVVLENDVTGQKSLRQKKLVGNLMTASENPAFSTSAKNFGASGGFQSKRPMIEIGNDRKDGRARKPFDLLIFFMS